MALAVAYTEVLRKGRAILRKHRINTLRGSAGVAVRIAAVSLLCPRGFRVKCAAFRGAAQLTINQGTSMFDINMTIEGFDDEIFAAIGQEERRQEEEMVFHL